MKAEDLMVGDRVFLFGDESVKVDCIGNVEVYLSDENGIDWRVTYDHIKPIPLTSESLEKNGFGYIKEDESLKHFYPGEECYCKNMDLHIGTNKKGAYWLNYLCNSIYGIRYVHELQHALKLCGIDLEIKLI